MEWYLRPIDWYLTATELIKANPQRTFWLWVATIVGALLI